METLGQILGLKRVPPQSLTLKTHCPHHASQDGNTPLRTQTAPPGPRLQKALQQTPSLLTNPQTLPLKNPL